jgi:alpha-L-fucosidase
MLVDVVSKNGNLLLSVPLRADGTFDDKEEAILNDIAAWLKVNGESIYATRPWQIFGEGPIAQADIKMKDQGFNEDAYTKSGADEIRFTQTKKHLYATALSWPDDGNDIIIKSLSEGSKLYPSKIKSVELLGYGKVKFSRTSDGLIIHLPSPTNSIAPVLRIKK